MGKLCMVLPPFAPDYSGVCSLLFSLGSSGLTIIHDASGCTGNYTKYDEPRWYHSRSPIYCSGLREMDAILGDDEKLVTKILLAVEKTRPTVIALVGSPVPMVIGTDLEGIAADIESRTGISTLGFSTTGLHDYAEGIVLGYKKLLWDRLKPTHEKRKGQKQQINLLGATPLDFGNGEAIEDLETLLTHQGYQVLPILWKDSSLEQAENLLEGSCNVVVSGVGLWFAEQMKKHYGIPYIMGLPFGEQNKKRWLMELEETLAGKEREKFQFPSEETAEILILGEQIQSQSIQRALWEDLNIKADVGAVCGYWKEAAETGVTYLETEEDIEAAINHKNYKFIVGDPLYKGLLQDEKKVIPYAHYALSSKIGKDWNYSLIGHKLKEHIVFS